MKLSIISAALLLAFTVSSARAQQQYGWQTSTILGDEDVAHGVMCKIKEISVMAKDETECKAVGGVATHVVKSIKEKIKH